MTRVVVIDDDPVYGELVCARLSLEDVDAVFHQGWHRSSVTLKQQRPDLVMIDVNMPGMPGTMLIETLRKLIDPMPKIILMSSMDISELQPLAKQFGADAAINKAASHEDMLATVRRLLKG